LGEFVPLDEQKNAAIRAFLQHRRAGLCRSFLRAGSRHISFCEIHRCPAPATLLLTASSHPTTSACKAIR
jgi:hypothetical protein